MPRNVNPLIRGHLRGVSNDEKFGTAFMTDANIGHGDSKSSLGSANDESNANLCGYINQ